jgi:UDP-4-amino-4,6-dideoxy-N-acetyl-beta-L-altrosamine N-acetyltransferase
MIDRKLIHLRSLERQDMPTLQKWMNDLELTRWLGHRFPISLEEQNRWFDKLVVDTSKKKLLIEDFEGHAIGLVSLMEINFKDRSAEFGIYLGEHRSIGKGLGRAATNAMLRFAFHELGLKRVYLLVLEENERAIMSFEDCGFKREAILRESVFFDGKYHNQLVMGILADEFDLITP